MSNADKFRPVTGKNVIENLTVGMYDDPCFVYREYVQNAADQIDAAKKQNLYQSEDEPSIYIQINTDTQTVIIEDNATGIESSKVLPLLGNIAQSTKNKYEDKGFRGIGRLGGLGYCEKLIFETSFYGENVKSTMIWDAKKLKEIINDDNIKIGAAELISIITDYSFDNNENADTHYFKVIMENVTNEVLLDIKQVRDYLSMVAPVPFSKLFTHRKKIYDAAIEKNIIIDEYNIYVNTDQLFKGYKNYIYKDNQIDPDREIINVEFFDGYFKDDLLYWGWYGVSKAMQQIPEDNKERQIRLRKSNIQIGLENRLDFLHKETRGNEYFIGEIYAINNNLIPNARRDFFLDNEESIQLSSKIRDFFYKKLNPLYRDFATKNSAERDIKLYIDLENQNQENTHNISEQKNIVEAKQKAEKAKQKLTKLVSKYEGSTLGTLIKEFNFDFNQEKEDNSRKAEKQGYQQQNTQSSIPEKALSSQEEAILKKVYAVLRQNLIKATAEELIQKIEEEIRK